MIDCYASLSHYASDYLVPIWRAIPEDQRGWFWSEPRVSPHLRALGVAHKVGRPKGPPRVVVVAGIHDVWAVRKMAAHKIVLVEHGLGQTYEPYVDPAWAGGPRREDVALFLCPNEHSAGRNQDAYPFTPAVVTGSVRVDELRRIQREPQDRPTVCLSFHHPGTGKVPWAGWALPHYEAGLPDVVRELRGEGWEVIGHGHPRARRHFGRLWRTLGIEHVPDFADVIRRASVYVCDNSSSQVESAACGLRQVLLEAPWYPEGDRGPWWRWDWPGIGLGTHAEDASVVGELGHSWDVMPKDGAVEAVVGSGLGQAAERSAVAICGVA